MNNQSKANQQNEPNQKKKPTEWMKQLKNRTPKQLASKREGAKISCLIREREKG